VVGLISSWRWIFPSLFLILGAFSFLVVFFFFSEDFSSWLLSGCWLSGSLLLFFAFLSLSFGLEGIIDGISSFNEFWLICLTGLLASWPKVGVCSPVLFLEWWWWWWWWCFFSFLFSVRLWVVEITLKLYFLLHLQWGFFLLFEEFGLLAFWIFSCVSLNQLMALLQ